MGRIYKIEKFYYNLAVKFWEWTVSPIYFAKYRWWVFRNGNKVEQAYRLKARVVNEMVAIGLDLSTSFEVKKWDTTAWFDSDANKITFPLCFLHPNMSAHQTPLHDIRHEYGHAFMDLAKDTVGYRKISDIFGELNTPYEDYLFICYHTKRLDRNNYLTKYAQVHPYEDFADTFALCLKSKGKISKYKKYPGAYKKLQFIKELIALVSS